MKGNSVFLYKTIVVGVMVLFIGMGVQPTFADEIPKSSEVMVDNNDDLPDLIVEDFELYSRIPEWGHYSLWAKIKNIGDAQTIGWFQFRVVIYRLILRKIPFPVRQFGDIYNFYNDTIIPEETQRFHLGSGDEIPSLRGYYRIFVVINMDKNIEESNYDNNERYENHWKYRVYWW